MIIGVPKEIKNNENRVGCTPAMTKALTEAGHRVVVEQMAGIGSGFADQEYQVAGAEILNEAAEVFATADLILKVKEPLKTEYHFLREGQLLFTYLHLAADRELTESLLQSKCIGIAYECVPDRQGGLPLLVPMSEVAGKMAAHIGAYYLAESNGGPGILLQGVPGVPAASVLVIGGGTVGYNAAKVAAGMGANVTILESNINRIRVLEQILPGNVRPLYSNKYNLLHALKEADLVIGAVLIYGAKAPHLVTREMLSMMKPGSVIVDVAVDQGGCIETIHPTTHSEPTYYVDGILHYGVANMPGAFPRTATLALTNATLPYVLELAREGEVTLKRDQLLAEGLNVYRGKLTCTPVAAAHGMKYEAWQ